MEKYIQSARLCMYLSVAVLAVTLSGVAVSLRDASFRVEADAHRIAADADTTVKRADLAIKEAQYLILQAGLTANMARKAAAQEIATLDELNRSITRTMGDLDATARSANRTLDATSGAVTAIGTSTSLAMESLAQTSAHGNTTLDQTTATLKDVQVGARDAHLLLSDPNIPRIVANAQTGTQALSTMTVETADAWHNYLHPKWPKRVWGYVTGFGFDAAKLFW